PRGCWAIVAELLGDVTSPEVMRIRSWLAPPLGIDEEVASCPLTRFSVDSVVNWVAADPKSRGWFIAGAVPKALGGQGIGRLAYELLDRYGDIEEVRDALLCHFWSGGWSGRASNRYRRKRAEAQGWLAGETSARVVSWIQEYIEHLSRDIERAEIEEERRD